MTIAQGRGVFDALVVGLDGGLREFQALVQLREMVVGPDIFGLIRHQRLEGSPRRRQISAFLVLPGQRKPNEGVIRILLVKSQQ